MGELEEVEDGGRGRADADEPEPPVFANFVGRVGDDLTLGGRGLFLDGVAGGVGFTAFDMLVFKGTRCGRGLIGRAAFSDGVASAFFWRSLSSFSSSELLNRLRQPVVGEGCLLVSINVDLGRYFGSADPGAVLGRRVASLPDGSVGLDADSSIDARAIPAEPRLRVIVLDSGVGTRLVACKGSLVSPMEARGAAGFRAIPLRRRVSLSLRAVLSESLVVSLLITSAKALLARPRDCLRELRVDGLFRGLAVAEGGLLMV